MKKRILDFPNSKEFLLCITCEELKSSLWVVLQLTKEENENKVIDYWGEFPLDALEKKIIENNLIERTEKISK